MDLLDLLEQRGAVYRGLTLFKNGLVSDGWIEKGGLFSDPAALEEVAAAQAQAVAADFPQATLLVGAPACGAVLAAFVARHLRLRVAFLTVNPALSWHRMNVPQPGEKVVYIDDLICTGTDARAALSFMRAQGQEVLGVSAWLSRTGLPGERLSVLAEAPFRNYPADAHPLSGDYLFRDVRE